MKRSDRKPLGCGICPYKTNSACHLERHLRIHTGQKPYACNMCSYKATDGGLLKRHMRIHSGEKPFTCQICGHKTAQSCSLKDHMAVHTGKKRYACDICPFQCSRIGRLRDHQLQHKVMTIKKEDSSEQSNQPQSDNAPEFRPIPCKCPQCDLEFPGVPNLNRHIATAHAKPSNENLKQREATADLPYHCSLCSVSADSLDTLNTHFTRHILYRCLECNSTFESSTELISHGPEHSEEFIFNCNKCDFKSKTRNELRGHERMHSSSQCLICTQCDFVSKSSTEFAQHLQTHTSTEMVQCNICSTKFGKTAELREHMVIHYSRSRARIAKKATVTEPEMSNIGTFHCYYCSYKSSEENQMAKHIQRVHTNPSLASEHDSKNDNEENEDASKTEIPDGSPHIEAMAIQQCFPPMTAQVDSSAKSSYGHTMQGRMDCNECNHCPFNSYGFHWLRSLERQFQPLTHFMNQNDADSSAGLPFHTAKCLSCIVHDSHHGKAPAVKQEILPQFSVTRSNDEANSGHETVQPFSKQEETVPAAEGCTQTTADASPLDNVGDCSPTTHLKRNLDITHQTENANRDLDQLAPENESNKRARKENETPTEQETRNCDNDGKPGNLNCGDLRSDDNKSKNAELLLAKLRQFFNDAFPKISCPSEGDSDQSTLTASSNQDILTIEVSSDSDGSDHSY